MGIPKQKDKTYNIPNYNILLYSDGDRLRTGLMRVISHLLIGLSVHYNYYYLTIDVYSIVLRSLILYNVYYN